MAETEHAQGTQHKAMQCNSAWVTVLRMLVRVVDYFVILRGSLWGTCGLTPSWWAHLMWAPPLHNDKQLASCSACVNQSLHFTTTDN